MTIKSLHVRHYRSIENEELACSELTALVGRNGSGKSSFLRALELFYSQNPKVDADDFYNRDTSREIEIGVTFESLSAEASKLFHSYLQNDLLTVERVFSLREGKIESSYHGSSLQNPEFIAIREAFTIKDSSKTAKARYKEIIAQAEYSDLPITFVSKDAVSSDLTTWESTHPSKCKRARDDGKFFGFKSVAAGYLGRFTRFLFIPAIRDASADAADSSESPINELMELVVRSILAGKPELAELKTDTQRQFSALMDPSKLTELQKLADDMTTTLKCFAPEASIEMSWQKVEDIRFPLPKADTKLNQDGYASPVGRAGHGLQRAFIITALQHLVAAQQAATKEPGGATLPVLVLAIEEPELYQHPNSQHHLAKILLELAQGRTPGVAERTQVIYGTHSPYFVGIDRIDQIRLLRKHPGMVPNPKVTKVVRTHLDEVAERVWEINGAEGKKYDAHTLRPRLHSIMTPGINEGFFADVAVLVEGEDDASALLGTAKALGHDLPSQGISVIVCNGKSSIDRPAVIFGKLGIATYVIWDGDAGKKEGLEGSRRTNHALLRLVGDNPVDFPATKVAENFACFEIDLETTLSQEIGGTEFEQYLADEQARFGILERKRAVKNPVVLSNVVTTARNRNLRSATLETVVAKVVEMRRSLS